MKIQLHPEAEKILRNMKILTMTKKEIARFLSKKTLFPGQNLKKTLKEIELEENPSRLIIRYFDWDSSEKGIGFWHEKYKQSQVNMKMA
jgi:hypothetical protein